MHTEILSYSALNPTSTGAAAVALSGDSLIVKNNQGQIRPTILASWGFQQATGFQQITYPSGHDTTRGYRFTVAADNTSARVPLGSFLPLTAQENLTITIGGITTGTELGCSLIYYPSLPGVNSRSISYQEYLNRLEKMTTIQASVTPTSATYSEALINAGTDLLMANRDYAVIGMESSVNCLAVTLRGTDLGNVRVGCPGGQNTDGYQANFFKDLSEATQLPLIPVINSGNRNNTYLGVVANNVGSGTPVPVTLFLALLA